MRLRLQLSEEEESLREWILSQAKLPLYHIYSLLSIKVVLRLYVALKCSISKSFGLPVPPGVRYLFTNESPN